MTSVLLSITLHSSGPGRGTGKNAQKGSLDVCVGQIVHKERLNNLFTSQLGRDLLWLSMIKISKTMKDTFIPCLFQ